MPHRDRSIRDARADNHSVRKAILAVFLFGASAAVMAAQTQQQPQSGPPKYDPAYERVAHGSGGQVIYMNRGDAGKTAAIVDAKQNRENIAALYGQTARGSLEVPVDSFTSVLYITLSGSQAGSDLKLVNPSGRQMDEGQGAQVVRMANTV